jgi:hypothetical protein
MGTLPLHPKFCLLAAAALFDPVFASKYENKK